METAIRNEGIQALKLSKQSWRKRFGSHAHKSPPKKPKTKLKSWEQGWYTSKRKYKKKQQHFPSRWSNTNQSYLHFKHLQQNKPNDMKQKFSNTR